MVCTRIHVLVRRLKKNGLGATCALVLACDSWVMKIDLFSNFSEPNNFKQLNLIFSIWYKSGLRECFTSNVVLISKFDFFTSFIAQLMHHKWLRSGEIVKFCYQHQWRYWAHLFLGEFILTCTSLIESLRQWKLFYRISKSKNFSMLDHHSDPFCNDILLSVIGFRMKSLRKKIGMNGTVNS